MSFYDLYAFKGTDIHEAKNNIELVLNIKFSERESDFQGGIYFISGNKTSENFILKNNIDPLDQEPVEIDYPEHIIILYVNDTDKAIAIKDALLSTNNFTLLRSEEL
ncbi:hypothetical protein U2T78_003053 [Providencia stuartii]|uniref:Uncharacterized protein n=1 Tax=Providencia stuartii TaxID=588 RepID=A0AAJ1JEW6_PROST|nr:MULTISPECIES: hypothetical protein [Providencia]EMA3642301.1 hypothetical protein [Providencia stuartii]MBW3103279.1 hypothetical protein [Providencia stuartii]MCB5219825.1 hypothetical protein [Providencia stuartii]MDE5306054.1 hypothetical protein [Providencia stuartii]MDE8749061.1 hypothetical protein [Providencia thailandensis]